jgi:cellulose synthase/poly-beta-1,6-N-acetylglucosamine synthase-like glycosyltransferase/tetratricopeptide (TPR) repeat protein
MTGTKQPQFKRRLAMIIAVVMTVVYLAFRGLFTLNLSSPLGVSISLVLYVAECYGGFLLFLYFFQIWDVQDPPPMPVLTGRTVDVLIPTYNEDPQLLRGTISAALKIDYPHRTYVLDDGKRKEVRALCEELGADYITRPTNLHAKAGNLNHALQMTDGEFVVIFDADHVSERHFIDRLIGYFADEQLGFVQTPHAFYNFDAFQGVLNYERGVYWEEGMLFYNVTQPGKNRWNGVSFCGSAAMFRRKALEDVGLVATESITEDMLTGLRMHAKGWRSLFVNERLIAAMAAEDITSFNTQRLRWGEGNLAIFAIDNPLTIKGLTWAQRLCYLGSMLSWTTGVQKLLIYCTPMLMLLTDVPPVNKMTWQLALIVGAYLAAVWTGVKIASNGYGWLLAIELSQMTCFWTQVRSTWRAIFKRRKARFVVTSKRGRQSNSILRHISPQIVYIAGSAIAICWAATRYRLNLSHDLIGLTIGSALLIVNSYLAWVVIRRALRSKDRRSAWRHPVALHVDYRTLTPSGDVLSGQCVTRDINEGGIGLVSFDQLPDKAELALTISAAGRSVACRGVVRSQVAAIHFHSRHNPAAQAFVYGVEYLHLDKNQLDTLWWMGAQFAVGLHYERFSGGQFGLGSVEARKLPACKTESAFELPVTLTFSEKQTVVAVTESIGPETMTLLLPEASAPQGPIQVKLGTPFGSVDASVDIVESKSRTLAGCTVRETRFRFRQVSPGASATLDATLGQRDSKVLGPVIRSTPQRRPPESLRPAALVMATTAIAASLVVSWVLLFEQDDVALARAEAGRYLTQGQVARLVEMAGRVHLGDSEEEARALRLRAVMVALDRPAEVTEIDEAFANSTPSTLEGLALKAESLQNLGRRQEADAIYQELLAKLDKLYDDRSRWDVVLAAARNASNLGDLADAAARYKELSKYGMLSDAAKLEYAGVLYRIGQADEAAHLLEQGSPNVQDLRLLASIYSCGKHFSKAIAIYEQLLKILPDDALALRGLADNLSWSHEFGQAATVYRELLHDAPKDDELRERLAETLLFDKQYQDSLRQYAKLLARHPKSQDFRNGFLMAAAGSPSLGEADRGRLERIYKQHGRHENVAYLTSLLNAVSKHGTPEQAVPLLQSLLEQAPDNAELRLRLADALHNLGRFKEADAQYRRLLGDSPPHAAGKSPAILPVEARR